MAYQVLRIEKRKGGAIRAIAQHIDRSNPPDYADPAKKHLNRELLSDGGHNNILSYQQIKDKIDGMLDQVKRKIRPDQVRCAEFLLSASPEYFRPPNSGLKIGEWDDTRLDRWITQSTQFIEQEIGPRAISATLHLDEKTPHIHALIVPIGDLSRWNLSFDEFAGNRQKFREWQNKYQQYVGDLGIERGEQSSRNNIPVREYHSRITNYLDFELQLQQRDQQLKALQHQLDQQLKALQQQQQIIWARDIVSLAQDLQRKHPNKSSHQLLPNGYFLKNNDDDGSYLLLYSDDQRPILKRDSNGAIAPLNINQQDQSNFQQHALNLGGLSLDYQQPQQPQQPQQHP